MRILSREGLQNFLGKFLFTLFAFVSYIASRRALEREFGLYFLGLVDGVVITVSALVIVSYVTKDSMHTSIDPRFLHLTVHYSQRTDTPDTPIPARPRYLVDNKRSEAWWVPTWLEYVIKQHMISWNSHDGEKALRRYLKENKIEIHNNNPLPEDFGLDKSVLSEPEK